MRTIKGWHGRVALLISSALIVACVSSTPTKPTSNNAKKGKSVVFSQSVEKVQKAAVDALVVLGFNIKKSEPMYVQGFRPHKVGFFVGSGGESAGVWLEDLGEAKTKVLVDTAKSALGIVGQKNWDDEILAEMEKSLGPKDTI